MPWSQEEDEILDDLVASFGPRPRILARQNAFPRFRSTKAIKVRRVRSHHVRRGVAVSTMGSVVGAVVGANLGIRVHRPVIPLALGK